VLHIFILILFIFIILILSSSRVLSSLERCIIFFVLIEIILFIIFIVKVVVVSGCSVEALGLLKEHLKSFYIFVLVIVIDGLRN
jgi:hypothetical protein